MSWFDYKMRTKPLLYSNHFHDIRRKSIIKFNNKVFRVSNPGASVFPPFSGLWAKPINGFFSFFFIRQKLGQICDQLFVFKKKIRLKFTTGIATSHSI